MHLHLFTLLVPALAFGSIANASRLDGGGSTRILVLDMAPEGEGQAAANRIFSIDPRDTDPTIIALVARLQKLPAGDSIAGTSELIAFLRANSQRLARHNSTRWISGKGDSLYIYVLRPVNRKAKLDFAEERRKSRVEADLITLAQVGQKISGIGVLGDEPDPVRGSFSLSRYALTRLRANFGITSTLDSVAPSGRQAKDDTPPTILRTTLITGPAEHLFLSANAAMTQARQVKYVESGRTLEPDRKPSEFLIGFNYSVGDLFEEDETASMGSFMRGMYLGFLVEASKRPFNQISGVVGFRRNLPLLDRYLSFNTVSPYAGLVWLRNDRRETAGSEIRSSYGRRDFIWGLSLNLDKALSWVGG